MAQNKDLNQAKALKNDGFYMQLSDIVVTNPPFSLFRSSSRTNYGLESLRWARICFSHFQEIASRKFKKTKKKEADLKS